MFIAYCLFISNPCQLWNLVKLLATPSIAPAVFGGGLLGYVMYDCTHYYLHHGQPSGGVAKHLKVRRVHMVQLQKDTSACLAQLSLKFLKNEIKIVQLSDIIEIFFLGICK